MANLTINDTEIEVPDGSTILEAADTAEIYIPRLCSHPDIPAVVPEDLQISTEIFRGSENIKTSESASGSYEGCMLCLVEIEGQPDPVRACVTTVEEGMRVVTSTPGIEAHRSEQMKKIFATHPHACVQCAQKAGCALEPCSTNVEKEERCCPIFHICELRKVAEFIKIPPDTSRYHPANLPVVEDEPLFLRDYNLCINCLRCVRICRDVREADALGFIINDKGDPVVGTKATTLKESECVFCLSCVEVCPTGTLRLKFEDPRIDGERITRCRDACPAGMDVARYLREIRRGEFARADAVIRETAPLPRVLGQICFHPCETDCLRNDLSESIAICSLKRAAMDNTDNSVWRSHLQPRSQSGKKVVIIGAGPAGLTASWFLKLKGHSVVVYDSSESPGGWLSNGIPRFRLSNESVEGDIKDIIDIGVELKLGIEIGKDINIEEIQSENDAVFIAVGAREGKKLPCEGTDLHGVENGLELLKEITSANGHAGDKFSGETVVIIGGGNVAIDIARTALRLGPDAVHLYCLEERDEMPAHDWEIAEAEHEGIIIHPGWGPTLISGDGKVEKIDFRKCTSVFNDACIFAPEFDETTTTSQDCDRILIAIGQESSLGFLENVDGIELSPARTIETDSDTMQTSVEGIFAGGEVVSGPASVIDAIAAGRRAASGIDKYLGGDGDIKFNLLDDTEPDPQFGKIENFFDLRKVKMPGLPVVEAVKCFDLAEEGYNREDAIRESERCLRCDLRLLICGPLMPPESWLELTTENVESVPESEGVYQLLDEEKVIYAIKGVDNLREALLEILETTEKARYFLYDMDPMFSKRESELIQEYLKVHGTMPPGEGEDDLDDLF